MEQKARSEKLILVYVPYPSRREAIKAARRLLESKLIACANIYASDSIYRWKGKITQEKEWTLFAKTTTRNKQHIVEMLTTTHPYELPAIVMIPVDANAPYATWVRGETQR